MSTPHKSLKDADHLKYGLLAAKSAAALEELMDKRPLSDENRQALKRAEKFLESLSSGAAIVTTSQSPSGKATKSVEVLTYARSPIEELQRQSEDKDVSSVLRKMAVALGNAAAAPATSREDDQVLDLTKNFFSWLYSSLLSSMERNRRQIARSRNMAFATAKGHG